MSITRVSVDSNGNQGNSGSHDSSISADGRYVAFESGAANLVAGDTNNTTDVFVYDRVTGITTRVSVDSSGNQGNDTSNNPSISADGRYVAFESHAANLVVGDTNNLPDIFVHDRVTGITTRVSVDSSGNQGKDGSSHAPSISADRRYVAFTSWASNLAAGDTISTADLFMHDRVTGTTTRVLIPSSGNQGNGTSYSPSISADGRYVAFQFFARSPLAGGNSDILVYDQVTGSTTPVSVDSSGNPGNGFSRWASISANGRYVAFESFSSNLVVGDTNNLFDIFVHDQVTGTTTRVSVDSSGNQGNNHSSRPSISADGRYVTFESDASNLVAGDTNNNKDVFVHDQVTGTTTRVSGDSTGNQGNSYSEWASISGDGRYVVFDSFSSNLVVGDTNNTTDIFIHDQQSNTLPAVVDNSTTTANTAATTSDPANNSGSDSNIISSSETLTASSGSTDGTTSVNPTTDEITNTSNSQFSNPIVGDLGDDTLTGSYGCGDDAFVLAADTCTDVVADLIDNPDSIGWSDSLSCEQLTITQGTDTTLNDTFINSNDETLAIVTGVQASVITYADCAMHW